MVSNRRIVVQAAICFDCELQMVIEMAGYQLPLAATVSASPGEPTLALD